MPRASPPLDDRDFASLLEAAVRQVRQSCPLWTDLSPGDPGVALLEAFAYLTDLMIRRLNRLPGTAYVEFLRLMGIRLYPPHAASVTLQFSIEGPRATEKRIPELTRVSVSRASGDRQPPVFVTAAPATITAGETNVSVRAYHVDFVEAELVGIGTGGPLQSVTLKQPPLVAPLDDFVTLIVAVQTTATDAGKRSSMREHDGRRFRIWQEVESFAAPGDERFFFTIDRVTGVVTFSPAIRMSNANGALAEAPASLAEYPAAGMEIRAWYARGGGIDGNVMPEVLTVMKSEHPGISVTNPRAGSGGASVESIDNALSRGPHALHSLDRAVTARDYEMFAVKNAAAARAKAFTQSEFWSHAVPGTVEVLLVPNDTSSGTRDGNAVTAERMRSLETPETLVEVARKLDPIKPLGTRCKVAWVRYKTVEVSADIVVHGGESPGAVDARVRRNLHDAINPLTTPTNGSGWKFGEPLRASRVYDIILAEPGVSYVERVRFRVDDVPQRDVTALAVDFFQRDMRGVRNTFFAAAKDGVYRSMNGGDSWERMGTFDGTPTALQTHPDRAGLVAVVITRTDNSGSSVHVSADCGESWLPQIAQFDTKIEDLAWTSRVDAPALLLATAEGLYEVPVTDGVRAPVQIIVEPAMPGLGFYAVVAFRDGRGVASVAVSAQGSGGVYLSVDGGKTKSFGSIGLEHKNVLTLGVESVGPRTFLWAGIGVAGNDVGDGAFRWATTGTLESAEGWRQFKDNWVGGTCHAFAFAEGRVYAATRHSGVVTIRSGGEKPVWIAPLLSCGLPTRSVAVSDSTQVFLPVHALAVSPGGLPLLAGGPGGVFSGGGDELNFENVSGQAFTERVALPPTWLFCSGPHFINVRTEDEAAGD